ncbi:TPA: hypothetical protein ACH3X1_001560 [Trebouxia sp. C0004]
MYTGQSVHNTRRGNMMHQQVEMHKSNQLLAEAAMCNEQNVTYYTDPPQARQVQRQHEPILDQAQSMCDMQASCFASWPTCRLKCIGNSISTLQDKQSRHI